MALARSRPQAALGLIERDEPLAALARILEEAIAGSGRFVVIRGEAGIGKTALLREVIRSAPDEVEVLVGACDGVSTPQPFGPLEDMVGALGPELRALLDANASRTDVGRWLLERLSDGRPRVLAIEDVQWADDATLELLAFLARRLETLPIAVLVTLREGDPSPTSVAWILGTIATLPLVVQLPVEPLSRAGVGRLATAAGTIGDGGRPSVNLDELHRITAGNPFYASEVLQSGGTGIPISVLDAVRARVATLDARAQRALRVLAVIGVRAEPWLLAAVAGEDLIGIDDCLAAGLLVKADGIAFRHELTRMAVLADLPVVHGIALHRKTLATLERAGTTDAARLAYHAEGAADRDAVVRYATAAAGRAFDMGALHEADAQLERALRHADGMAGDQRAELLEKRTLVLHLLNEISEAYRVGQEALALRRAGGDAVRIGSHLSFLSFVTWLDGRGEEAWVKIREAVAILEPLGDSVALARAYAALGRLGLSAGVGDAGLAASGRAVDIGRRVGDPEAVSTALATIGTVERLADDPGGREHLEESLQIARDAHIPAAIDRALNNLGFSSQLRREYHDAEHWFDELAEHSERSEIERCSVNSARSEMALATGDWIKAEREARAALAAPRTDPIDRAIVMVVLARLALRRGGDDVDALLAPPIAAAAAMGTAQIRWPLASFNAERAWIEGHLESAVDEVRAAHLEARDRLDAWTSGELGIWLWRAGAPEDLDDAPLPYRLEAEGRAADAAAEWRRLDAPYDAAVALLSSSDPDDVLEAHTILVGLGAMPVAAIAARRLRELGTAVPRGPRPTTLANAAGLTEREAEIARLLADGLSNAEIAELLVLSPKTVGHHVSAVLGKLNVPRRGAVAGAIREHAASR